MRLLHFHTLLCAALAAVFFLTSCGGAEPTNTPTTAPQVATPTSQPPTSVPSPTLTVPLATQLPTSAPTRQAPTATTAQPTATPRGTRAKFGGILTRAYFGEVRASELDVHNITGGTVGLQAVVPLYNTLLKLDPETHTRVLPSLASSWTVSSDGTTWTLNLRKDVKWSDSRLFTADDVVFTLDRILHPPQQARSGISATTLAALTGVTRIDDYTVKLTIDHPVSDFAERLAFSYDVIYPKHIVSPLYAAGKQIEDTDLVGTGPFLLKAHARDVSWEYARKKDYWDKDAEGRPLPYLDGIQGFIIVDDTAAFAAFRTKQVLQSKGADRGIRPEFVPTAEREAATRGYRLVRFSGISWIGYLYFNNTRAPFNDRRFRQVLNLALDRETLATFYDQGARLTKLGGPLDPTSRWGIPETDLLALPGFRRDKSQDLAEAKRLLADLGIPKDFPFDVVTLVGPQVDIFGAMIPTLESLGLKPKLRILSTAEGVPAERDGKFDVVFRTYNGVRDDPSDVLIPYAQSHGLSNFGRYNSPEMDRLLDLQERETDPNKRQQLVRQTTDFWMKDWPAIPAFWIIRVNGLWNEVQGIGLGPGLLGLGDTMDMAWLDLPTGRTAP